MNKGPVVICNRLVREIFPGDNGYDESDMPVLTSRWNREYKEIDITIDLSKVISFHDLVDSLGDERENCDLSSLFYWYQSEVSMLDRYAGYAKMPDCSMLPFRRAGSQFIAEFWVNDLFLPKEDKVNWHLQNTSQWKYAGCILYDKRSRRISTHH